MPGSKRGGRQERKSGIFIKIISREACDESSVNAQRDIQQDCARSSGNVNQHSPVNFNRAPRFELQPPQSPSPGRPNTSLGLRKQWQPHPQRCG